MDAPGSGGEFSRGATFDDLIKLCQHLNKAKARYVVIGGFAVIHHGYFRGTNDIDLLIDSSAGNLDRVRRALLHLPDQAIREVQADEISNYQVLRVADEFVVDLMTKACGIEYEDARDQCEIAEIQGVKIPFLKPELLIQTKNTHRPIDMADRLYLQQLIEKTREPGEKKKPWWRW